MLPAATCYKKLIVLCGPKEEWQKHSLNSVPLTSPFDETVPWHQDGRDQFLHIVVIVRNGGRSEFSMSVRHFTLTLKIHNTANSFDSENHMILVTELFS